MNFDISKFSFSHVKSQMDATSFRSVALVVLAASSFLMGCRIGENFIPGLEGFFSQITAGIFMVLFFDGAARYWAKRTTEGGCSQEQLVAAGRLQWFFLGESVTVSVLFFVLSMSLIDVSSYMGPIGIFCTILISLAIVVNAVGIYYHGSQSPENIEARRKAEDFAAAAAVEHQNRRMISNVRLNGKVQATEMIARQVYKNIQEASPEVAKAETVEIMDEWRREFGSLSDGAMDLTVDPVDFKVADTTEKASTTLPVEELETAGFELDLGK